MRIKIERVSAETLSVPYLIVRHIARGTETHARVVRVTLTAGGKSGRGEAHPTLRYDETEETILAAVEAARPHLEAGVTREELLTLMKPGPARNAVDCALWDLEAKLSGESVEAIAGVIAYRMEGGSVATQELSRAFDRLGDEIDRRL